jgi:putative membrane protein insertion efficiency factor
MQLKNIKFIMAKPFIFLIICYQKFIFKSPSCKYYPCCSEYFKQSLIKFGLFKGMKKGILRMLKCNPWSKGGVDKV